MKIEKAEQRDKEKFKRKNGMRINRNIFNIVRSQIKRINKIKKKNST